VSDVNELLRKAGSRVISGVSTRLDGRRRVSESDVDRMYREIVDTWDRERFIATFRDDWNPFPVVTAPKYLNLDTWLRRAIRNYLELDLFSDDGGRRRVLDLGCGMGYFLEVCRHRGHDVVG
jgi:SAM-dependent methyltransferase